MALLETLGDLPLDNVADSSSILLPACQQQQSRQQPSLNSPSKPASHCCCSSSPRQSHDHPHQITLRCLSASHAVTRAARPPPPVAFTSALHTCMRQVTPPPPLMCPPLTKSICRRHSNRPRFALSGSMSSSLSCGSVQCEFDARDGRQASRPRGHNTTYGSCHKRAMQRTPRQVRSIISHVSKSKRLPLMVMPSSAWARAHMAKVAAAAVQRCGGC